MYKFSIFRHKGNKIFYENRISFEQVSVIGYGENFQGFLSAHTTSLTAIFCIFLFFKKLQRYKDTKSILYLSAAKKVFHWMRLENSDFSCTFAA